MRLLTNASVYLAATLLQRGLAFVLAPLYTRFLTPADYGVTGVVGSLVPILTILFGLAMQSSITRLYFRYRDTDPARVERIWGTALTVTLINVAVLGGILFASYALWAPTVLGPIEFYPFAALGLANGAGTAIFTLYQTSLNARQQSVQYAGQSLALFVGTALVSIVLVVGLHWGALGALTAGAAVQTVFAIYGLVRFLPECRFGLDREVLREVLRFSAPLVPHQLAAALTGSLGKIVINGMLGSASAGLYHVGLQFGNLVDLVGTGVNRAFMPWFYEQMEAQEDRRATVARTGESIIYAGCLFATGLSLLSPDVVRLLLAKSYRDCWRVIPWLSFAYVFRNVYYVGVAPLFLRKIRGVPAASAFNLVLYVPLAVLGIRMFGWVGAAAALTVSHCATSMFASWLGCRAEVVGYHWWRIYGVSLVCAAGSILGAGLPILIRWAVCVVALVTVTWLMREDFRRIYKQLRAGKGRRGPPKPQAA